MQISTGIFEDEHGVQMVGLRVTKDDDDNDPITIVLPPEIARQVAFALMEEADKIMPPAWRKE